MFRICKMSQNICPDFAGEDVVARRAFDTRYHSYAPCILIILSQILTLQPKHNCMLAWNMLGASRVMDVVTSDWNVVGVYCIPFMRKWCYGDWLFRTIGSIIYGRTQWIGELLSLITWFTAYFVESTLYILYICVKVHREKLITTFGPLLYTWDYMQCNQILYFFLSSPYI